MLKVTGDKSRRQKAEGRRQGAEDRKQKAGGGAQIGDTKLLNNELRTTNHELKSRNLPALVGEPFFKSKFESGNKARLSNRFRSVILCVDG